MKPAEKKPDTVFRIIDRATGGVQGSYSRAYCDEYDFASPESARNANCHGVYADKTKFAIAKYRVTYELIEDDVDPPSEEEIASAQERDRIRAEDEAEMARLGITEPFSQMQFLMKQAGVREMRRIYDELTESHKSRGAF